MPMIRFRGRPLDARSAANHSELTWAARGVYINLLFEGVADAEQRLRRVSPWQPDLHTALQELETAGLIDWLPDGGKR